MTKVLITIDTELSAGLNASGLDARANLETSIRGRCAQGEFGVGWQMDQLDRYGLKGVFFVDPMPALVHGEWLVAEIVEPIVARGHEVQLHIHTEWLEWAHPSPVGGRQGRDLADFTLEDQQVLLALGSDLIQSAGAPKPVAFRAGNYGADINTLRALALIGFTWDSSYNACYRNHNCRIFIESSHVGPMVFHGVTEIPISDIFDWPGHVRPAQVCAMSTWEMRAALRHAAENRHATFTIITHSFEMLTRDRRRANEYVIARFDSMCRFISNNSGLQSVGFNDLDAERILCSSSPYRRLSPNVIRTVIRYLSQSIGSLRYESGFLGT